MWPWGEIPPKGQPKRYFRRVERRFVVDRFAVLRFAVLRLAVERLAVLRFAVERFAVERLAVDRFAVDRFAVRRRAVRFAVPERDVAAGIAGAGASVDSRSSLEPVSGEGYDCSSLGVS